MFTVIDGKTLKFSHEVGVPFHGLCNAKRAQESQQNTEIGCAGVVEGSSPSSSPSSSSSNFTVLPLFVLEVEVDRLFDEAGTENVDLATLRSALVLSVGFDYLLDWLPSLFEAIFGLVGF